MPTPIIPNVIRAQVVLQGSSNKPEDRYVNTFHFETIDSVAPNDEDYDKVRNVLREFYNTEAFAGGVPIASRLSPNILRTEASHIRMYHLGDPEPREPHIGTLNLGPPTESGAALPAELAVVMTFVGGRNIEGRRGRVYLGPWGVNMLGDSDGGDRRINESYLNQLSAYGARLAANENDVRLVVLSQARRQRIEVDGEMRAQGPILPPQRWNVTGGWVDDSWDIQRRRGGEATARVTF